MTATKFQILSVMARLQLSNKKVLFSISRVISMQSRWANEDNFLRSFARFATKTFFSQNSSLTSNLLVIWPSWNLPNHLKVKNIEGQSKGEKRLLFFLSDNRFIFTFQINYNAENSSLQGMILIFNNLI